MPYNPQWQNQPQQYPSGYRQGQGGIPGSMPPPPPTPPPSSGPERISAYPMLFKVIKWLLLTACVACLIMVGGYFLICFAQFFMQFTEELFKGVSRAVSGLFRGSMRGNNVIVILGMILIAVIAVIKVWKRR